MHEQSFYLLCVQVFSPLIKMQLSRKLSFVKCWKAFSLVNKVGQYDDALP